MSVFLDYNATSPLRPEVKDGMISVLGPPGNPSSVHEYGRVAKTHLEKARIQVAKLSGSEPDNIIFTSCGTEANTMVLNNAQKPLVSSIEHEAVLNSCKNISFINVSQNGQVDLLDFKQKLEEVKPDYLSVMWANNETGIIQPIPEIIQIAKSYNVHIHCDAVQAVGKIPIDFKNSGLDSMAISAHKLGGPSGVGALVLSNNAFFDPLIKGGGQEKGRRSGTENLSGIVGFGIAAQIAKSEVSNNKVQKNRHNVFEKTLKDNLSDIKIIGENVERLPNTSALYMPYLSSETQVIALDLEGFAISAGSACSSGKVKKSHVLEAMGISWASDKTIRVSSGWQNNSDDLEKLAQSYIELYKKAEK